MGSKTMMFMVLLIALTIGPTALFGQTGSVGDIRLVSGEGNEIMFEVYDLSVTGMKGRQIYFAFCLSQNGQWVRGSWVQIQNQSVGYSPAYWNGKACWFTYDMDKLADASDLTKAYSGTFFIVIAADDGTIASASIPFNLKGASSPSSTRTTYDEEQTETASGGEKNMMDYFREAEGRLVRGYGSLKKDPKIVGEWMSIVAGPRRSYSVFVYYLCLNSDGTGIWEKNPFYLTTKGALAFDDQEYGKWDIRWGVELLYTENGEPVTMLKLTFTVDGSSSRLYYAFTDYGTLASVFYDEETQRPSSETRLWNTKDVILADWEANSGKLRDALWKAYQTDQECDQMYWDTMFMIEMNNHYTMMNILNNF